MTAFRTLAATGLLALAAAAPLHAQAARVGLKAGITSSTIVGDDAEGAESLTGISGGAFVTIPVAPGFAVQPELLYVSRGAAVDFEDEFNADLKLTYIQIPVLAKFSFGTGPARPTLFAGPAIAYRTGCEVEVDAGDISGSFDCDDDGLDVAAFKSTDFSAVVGVGLDYALAGGAMLVFDARLDLGLTSLDDTGGDADAKNRAWSFMAGFSIPVGSR